MVLPVLPPVAALNFPVIIFEQRTQWTILPDFISQKKSKQKRRKVQKTGGWKNSNRASLSVLFSILAKSGGAIAPTDPRFRRSCKKLKQTQFTDIISFKCQMIYTFLIIKYIFQNDYFSLSAI